MFLAKYSFAREDLVDIWSSNNRSEDALIKHILEKINKKNLKEAQIRLITIQVKDFIKYIKKHMPSCNRSMNQFKKRHSKWIAGNEVIEINEPYVSPDKIGRPSLSYENAGSRLKRKIASELALESEHSTPLLIHAATVSAKKSKDSAMAFVLQKAGGSDNISEVKKKLTAVSPTPISADSALAFLIENGLTKQQYINIKKLSKEHGCDIYPSYSKIVESKLKCRPNGILCSETKVQVSLQNVLDHTAYRILTMQEDVFESFADVTHCKLIFSYGFDGSTGHSLYKQRFELDDSSALDNSLFVTTIIPLKLIDELQRVIWVNKTPQSVRFCRPLKIEFVKESTALILKERENLDNQTQNLQDYVYRFKTQEISVQYNGHLTLIDGKILNILTGTNSCQSCPICGAKPTQLLNTKDFNSKVFNVKPDSLQYGLSPLHAWIRFFDFVLRLSYRLELKKWHVKGDDDKAQLESRKQMIQKKCWEEMSLNVDKPKPNGSGNSNDGNTARRAFSNSILLSSILGIEHELLHRFHTILIAISCEYAVNSEKFKDFCANTFRMYMENYSWYPMSPTVHKVVVHGYKIMDSCIVPVGFLGENASEARNKLYKSDRRSHARKCSRLENITDVFNRAMDSSDPLLSTLSSKERQNRNKRKSLPAEVIALLESPCIEPNHIDEDCDPTHTSSDEENYVQDSFGIEDTVLEEAYTEFLEN